MKNAGNKKQMTNYQISLDPNDEKRGLFDILTDEDRNQGESTIGQSSVIRTLTKYVTSK